MLFCQVLKKRLGGAQGKKVASDMIPDAAEVIEDSAKEKRSKAEIQGQRPA